jgi:regulator of sirC expression with transglutaminase-like and TPR domain
METATAIQRFEELVSAPGETLDLAECAFTIAGAMQGHVDVAAEVKRLADLTNAATDFLTETEEGLARVNGLNEYLFDVLEFAGNVDDYYDPRNSLLNEVIDRRLGIPITLALIYIVVGRRFGMPLMGIGMPGHFLVRHEHETAFFIDPYNRGVILSEHECVEQFERINAGMRWDPAFLSPISDRAIIARMLRNLGAIWTQRQEFEMAERVMTMLIALQPREPGHKRDRGVLRYRQGKTTATLADLESYIDPVNGAPDAWYVRRLVDRLRGGSDYH